MTPTRTSRLGERDESDDIAPPRSERVVCDHQRRGGRDQSLIPSQRTRKIQKYFSTVMVDCTPDAEEFITLVGTRPATRTLGGALRHLRVHPFFLSGL